MKVLIALHNKGDRELYSGFAERQELVIPRGEKLEEVLEIIETQHPDRVLADANYYTYVEDYSPLKRIAEKMTQRGYSLENSLLGITNNDLLIKRINRESPNLPVAKKMEISKIAQFLSSK